MSGIPKGWTNRALLECVDVLDNLRVPVNSDERAKRFGNVPYYGATGQVGWIDGFLFNEELLLIGEDGAPFFDKSKQISYIIRGKSWVNNHAHVLRAKHEITSSLYLKWYLDGFNFQDHVNGTTSLKRWLPWSKTRREPGTKSLWLGLQRLNDLTAMWEVMISYISHGLVPPVFSNPTYG